MKKLTSKIMGRICYTLGVLASLYVGGWLMLILPIEEIVNAIKEDTVTIPLLVKNIITILFSTTVSGFVWCIGYFGYNYFKGTEEL